MVAKPKEISDAKARSIKIVFKESLDSGFDYSSPESKALIVKKKLEFYAELYNNMPNHIGKALNYLLTELKMSKIKLANEADINRKMVFKIISGQMTIHVEPMGLYGGKQSNLDALK